MRHDKKIHIAFQFHVNFYHSYRGDTPDELGFGKDIRIIRYTIASLDELNAAGVPVRGTWDIENYYSMEQIMPKHCPELLEALKRRAGQGDEIELMSYNNGLVSAFTPQETERVLEKSISNSMGSGLRDVFGDFAPVCRPQESMHTPGLERYYSEAGVEALELFYSAVPFTSFSNFIPKLDTATRYNPFLLDAGSGRSITAIPALNAGDIVERLSVRGCIEAVRREQNAMAQPCDLLMIFDVDADDEFWFGYLNRMLSKDGKPVIKGGIHSIVRSVAKLPYVVFDTPYSYLKEHPPVKVVRCALDLADGSHDGYSSWAEKRENTELWSIVERSRSYCDMANALGSSALADKLLEDALDKRILVLSTTHFGLASPVMNRTRLQKGMELANASLESAKKACEALAPAVQDGRLRLIARERKDANFFDALVPLCRPVEDSGCFISCDGSVKLVLREFSGTKELELGEGNRLSACEGSSIGDDRAGAGLKRSRLIISVNGRQYAVNFFVRFDGKVVYGKLDEAKKYQGEGVEQLCVKGSCSFGEAVTRYRYVFTRVDSIPYIYVDCDVDYGKTEHVKFGKIKARLLDQSYDSRWEETAPFELTPIKAGEGNPVVHKHNFLGERSCASLDVLDVTGMRQVDSMNNFISCGWVGFSQSGAGLLLAQSTARESNFAFCPVRLKRASGATTVLSLNPFGTYHGSQLKNALASTGLGTKAATLTCAQYDSYAPSYNGKEQHFSLMLAGFGESPEERLTADAEGFAYPPFVLG